MRRFSCLEDLRAREEERSSNRSRLASSCYLANDEKRIVFRAMQEIGLTVEKGKIVGEIIVGFGELLSP